MYKIVYFKDNVLYGVLLLSRRCIGEICGIMCIYLVWFGFAAYYETKR